ncbi:MAG TPA: hypothetical protein VF904_10365 [Anaeromyxobacteraceae bacterium]
MPDDNPWAPWGIVRSVRDGHPILTETQLWQLDLQHPEVVERAGKDEVYVHLEQPYRLVTLSDRAFRMLMPAPGRAPPRRSA